MIGEGPYRISADFQTLMEFVLEGIPLRPPLVKAISNSRELVTVEGAIHRRDAILSLLEQYEPGDVVEFTSQDSNGREFEGVGTIEKIALEPVASDSGQMTDATKFAITIRVGVR